MPVKFITLGTSSWIHTSNLCVVDNLMRHENAIWLAFGYDVKVVIPLIILVAFDSLNPTTNASSMTTIYVA